MKKKVTYRIEETGIPFSKTRSYMREFPFATTSLTAMALFFLEEGSEIIDIDLDHRQLTFINSSEIECIFHVEDVKMVTTFDETIESLIESMKKPQSIGSLKKLNRKLSVAISEYEKEVKQCLHLQLPITL